MWLNAFRRYLTPLLGSGMPDMQRLHSHPVANFTQKLMVLEALAAEIRTFAY